MRGERGGEGREGGRKGREGAGGREEAGGREGAGGRGRRERYSQHTVAALQACTVTPL